jgi:uncharacterized protein YegP (UPF0339 family)
MANSNEMIGRRYFLGALAVGSGALAGGISARAEEARPEGRYFEICIVSNGDYRWHFKGANGRTIATSEGYTTKQSCRKSIEMMQSAYTEIRDEGVRCDKSDN